MWVGVQVAAAVVTMIEYAVGTIAVSTLIFWTFWGLGRGAAYASRVVSLLHALVQSVFGVVCVMEAAGIFDPADRLTKHTMVFGMNTRVTISGHIFVGYIFYDVVHALVMKDLRKIGDIVHHILFLGISYLGLTHRILQFAFSWLILGEVSTIFLNIRWFLFKAGLEESSLYIYNGMCLVLTFFFFRVVVFGLGLLYLFIELLPIVNESDDIALRGAPYILLAAYCMNLNWFVQLAAMALGTLDKAAAKAKQKPS